MKLSHRTALPVVVALSTMSLVACDVGTPIALTADRADDASDQPVSTLEGRDRFVGGGAEQARPQITAPKFGEPPVVGGGGGGGEAAAECNAIDSLSLDLDVAVDVKGDTTNASDNAPTSCFDPGNAVPAPDRAYEIVVPEDCTLVASLETDGGFRGILDLRSGCSGKAGEIACADGNTASSIRRGVTAGTYYLVVDGLEGSSGQFLLHAKCATPVCGDGVVNPATETCDNGAQPSFKDGCIDPGKPGECRVESPVAATVCADTVPIEVAPQSVTLMPSSGVPYDTHLDTSGTVVAADPSGLGDHIFEFVPTADGALDIRIGLDANASPYCAKDLSSHGCWNHLLYARQDACDGATIQSSYPNFATDDGVNGLLFAVTHGVHYFVFVAGFGHPEDATGEYFLKVSLLPPQ